MQITFHGAAQGVTGSKHLIEAAGKRILLDCGMFQGRRREAETLNRTLPFDPRKIDALILSHSHIDHSGAIPFLVKSGFNGPIFCTTATKDLCNIMLPDSAHIQERDAEYVNKIEHRRGRERKLPLYNIMDAEKALRVFKGVFYRDEFEITPDIRVTFRNAGHILGSACVKISIRENRTFRDLIFTGDLGRKNLPIIQDPDPFERADIFISETTYGDRVHEPTEKAESKLAGIIKTVYKRGGKVIIPAFSVGRSQEIIYTLNRLIIGKKIPELPIFIDSPLTLNVTEVFNNHHEYYDAQALKLYENDLDPFGFTLMNYITSVDDSKRLNDIDKPCIIMSASGMCEHGRILHHLANNIEDSRNMILIVGFQAEGTLGRRLVEKAEEVKIFGIPHRRLAGVEVMNSFSAHGDKADLLSYIKGFKSPPKKTFLVHGEAKSLESYGQLLADNGFKKIYVPRLGETVNA